MATKKSKRPTSRVKTLKAKNLTTKHSKRIKGGTLGMMTTQTYLATLNQSQQIASNLGQKTSSTASSIIKNLG